MYGKLYSYEQMKKRYPKFRFVQNKTTLKKRTKTHPGTIFARQLLRDRGVFFECAICKKKLNLHVHHINKNPYDNSLQNLQILCRMHHLTIHDRKPEVINEFEDIPYDDSVYRWSCK